MLFQVLCGASVAASAAAVQWRAHRRLQWLTVIVLGLATPLHEGKPTVTIQGTIEFLEGAATELSLKSRSL